MNKVPDISLLAESPDLTRMSNRNQVTVVKEPESPKSQPSSIATKPLKTFSHNRCLGRGWKQGDEVPSTSWRLLPGKQSRAASLAIFNKWRRRRPLKIDDDMTVEDDLRGMTNLTTFLMRMWKLNGHVLQLWQEERRAVIFI